MVYVVETFQLSDEVRADPSFGKWLQEFNSLVLERNPAVKSLNVHAAYTGAFGMEVWFGMQHFFALDRSVEAARAMFQNLEVMKEFEKSTRGMKPAGRRIMLPLE